MTLKLPKLDEEMRAKVREAALRRSYGGLKVIHSMSLASFLMARGFVLLRTEPNRRGTGRNIFLFKSSAELDAATADYIYQRKEEPNTNGTRPRNRSDRLR